MLNPLRSEREAFRFLLLVVVVAAVVIVVLRRRRRRQAARCGDNLAAPPTHKDLDRLNHW